MIQQRLGASAEHSLTLEQNAIRAIVASIKLSFIQTKLRCLLMMHGLHINWVRNDFKLQANIKRTYFGNIVENLDEQRQSSKQKKINKWFKCLLSDRFLFVLFFLHVAFIRKSRWGMGHNFTYWLARPHQPPLRAWGSTILASAVYREHPSSLANYEMHKDFEYEWILWQPSSPFDVILTDAQRAVCPYPGLQRW